MANEQQRRSWTITKFGRHPDGYLHARVVENGKPIYVTRRFGSWMAPGTHLGRKVLKEIPSIEIKQELQKKALTFEKGEAHEQTNNTAAAGDPTADDGENVGGDLRPGGDDDGPS